MELSNGLVIGYWCFRGYYGIKRGICQVIMIGFDISVKLWWFVEPLGKTSFYRVWGNENGVFGSVWWCFVEPLKCQALHTI